MIVFSIIYDKLGFRLFTLTLNIYLITKNLIYLMHVIVKKSLILNSFFYGIKMGTSLQLLNFIKLGSDSIFHNNNYSDNNDLSYEEFNLMLTVFYFVVNILLILYRMRAASKRKTTKPRNFVEKTFSHYGETKLSVLGFIFALENVSTMSIQLLNSLNIIKFMGVRSLLDKVLFSMVCLN